MTRNGIHFFARVMFVSFSVVTLIFFMQRLLPGSPADAVLGVDALLADKQRWLAERGLDRPLFEQYLSYLEKLLRGDFGRRWIDDKPVWPILRARFAETLRLALAAFTVSVCCALFFGLIGALKAGRKVDTWLAVLSLVFISTPTFVSGTVFLWIFSVWLDLFPLTGSFGWESLILPSFALGLALSAVTGRMLRASLLEVLQEDFVRTAYSKGLSRIRVFMVHALRNALLPTITLFGLQLGTLLGGAVVTEQVFTWPGLGALMVEAVSQRDYNLLGGCVVILAVVQVCAAAAVDLVHQLVDPRLREL